MKNKLLSTMHEDKYFHVKKDDLVLYFVVIPTILFGIGLFSLNAFLIAYTNGAELAADSIDLLMNYRAFLERIFDLLREVFVFSMLFIPWLIIFKVYDFFVNMEHD